jgi:quinoprotein glucose dehydrogenase
VQVTKQAFAFVFDRTNGQPVWPIEERPVPVSDTPGERTSPTQPFPTRPPPFDRQGVSIDDLIDFTPALRAEAEQLVKQYRIGPLFTPPSIRGDGPGRRAAPCSCPDRSAGPTGKVRRSIPTPACCTSNRSRVPSLRIS